MDLDLRHLAGRHCGTWRFPEESVREWTQQADEALGLAAKALPEGIVVSDSGMAEYGFVTVRGLEHLGILVNFKARTLLRRGYDEPLVVKSGAPWDLLKIILKAGPEGIEAYKMKSRYQGESYDACRRAVTFLRTKLMQLGLTISNRRWAIVDVEDNGTHTKTCL